MSQSGEITELLKQLTAGNREAESKLVPLVYEQLRRLAASYMRRERPDHTLQPTALVHEAYLKLMDQRRVSWQNRSHFYRLAARLMRRVLVDHAREVNASKRAKGQKVALDEWLASHGRCMVSGRSPDRIRSRHQRGFSNFSVGWSRAQADQRQGFRVSPA